MKVSIHNFKSIRSLIDFELKPFTVLSGVNSSGKSSFIQFLLLLKQTIDLDSSQKLLSLNGDLYQVKEFQDILFNKDLSNKLKVSFDFNKSEIVPIENPKRINIFDSFADYHCIIEITYDHFEEKEFINEFMVKFILPEGDKREQYIKFINTRNGKNEHAIDTNTGIFSNELFFEKPTITNIVYSSIYPNQYETLRIIETTDNDGNPVKEEIRTSEVSKIDGIKVLVDYFFKNISYIGPLREKPRDDYSFSGSNKYVGVNGEFVAQVLENYAKEPVQYNTITLKEDGIDYLLTESTLLDGVKYWMCDVFGIASNIYSEKVNDNYKIVLVSDSGLKTTIKHVGFGISQLLPIIVEGLRLGKGSTLILEQPEIHLHPKLQSLLFDFLYGLIKQGKSVLIETHSDHFITRMRRRIAEDLSNSITKNVNLTFIETNKGKNLFRSIDLDDYGTLNYFPTDFIEQSNVELKAIVKAQMKKRIQNQKK